MPPLLRTPARPGLHRLVGLARRLRDLPVASQQGARRNAMVACTAASARRVEHQEVEDYLTALAAARRDATAHG